MSRYLILICGLLWIQLSLAVEVQQGQRYDGGTRVESSELGIAFTIPQGWIGAWPAGSEMFILESQDPPGNIFVYIDQGDMATLKDLVAAPIPLDGDTLMQPVGSPKVDNNVVSADYTVSFRGQPYQGHIAGRVVRGNTAVAFIALADSTNSGSVNKIADRLAQSLAVSEPSAPQGTAGANSWQQYLKGRYLARYYTGSGYSENQHLWLCSDGSFYHSFGSGGHSMGGASGASQSKGHGRWSANGNVNGEGELVLQFGAGKVVSGSTPDFDWAERSAGGERWTYTLNLKDKLYLNGNQWMRGSNERCN